MSKSPEEILSQVLSAENRVHANVPIIQDPVVESEMVLSIEQIHTYDNNPRKALNEKYDELKLSISKRGYTSVLEVTRRPNEDKYIVCAGANTTLAIIKELYQETRDKRFAKLRCLFKPWTSESEVIFNHLIENSTHGRMIFIDKARGVLQAKTELERELNKELSLREFCKLAEQNCGFKVDPTTLGRYIYAVNTLYPLMPKALASGIGYDQIKKIKQIEDAYSKYMQHHNLEVDLTGFELALNQADMSVDGGWTIENIEEYVAENLADICAVSRVDARLDLRTLLDNGALVIAEVPEYVPIIQPRTVAADEPTVEPKAIKQASATATPEPEFEHELEPAFTADAEPYAEAEPVNTALASNNAPAHTRESAYKLAHAIATFFGVDDYLLELDTGNGFAIDFPQEAAELAGKHAACECWFYLASLSDQISDHLNCINSLQQPSSYKFYIEKLLLAEQERIHDPKIINNPDVFDPFNVRVGSQCTFSDITSVMHLACDQAIFDKMQQLQSAHFFFTKRAQELGLQSLWGFYE